MPAIINTNIASLNAQRNLNSSQGALQTALQRLSSGLRINSAKDDAAGMAISERMTTQIRGLNQAARNANDGVSLAQTADSALAELTSNLQRIRELAVQAANSTNTSSDRAALDLEVQQRLAEIDRSATQTAFNGQKVLDGNFGTATFQVGANVGETISVGLTTSMRTTAIGKTADYVGGAAYSTALNVGQQGAGVTTGALASGAMSITLGSGSAVSVGGSASFTGSASKGEGSTSAYAKAGAINGAGVGGLTATADTTVQYTFGAIDTTAGATDTYTLTVNSQAIYTATTGVTLSGDQVAAAINANASATGVTATYDGTNTRMTLQSVTGGDIAVTQTKGAGSAGVAEGFVAASGTNNSSNTTTLSTAAGASTSVTMVGSIRLVAAEAITLGGAPAPIGYTATSFALGASALNSASVTTVANANTTIGRIDAALTSVSTLRSTFGAIQNRFESAIASLQATSENLTAARSRIQDTDFAAETAQLTRAQILQQAGTAMLAQANQVPNIVLGLLK